MRRGAWLAGMLLGACSAGGGTSVDAGRSAADGAVADAGRDARAREIPDSGFLACETTTAFADPLPATLLFTVDTSGSMNCPANDRSCANAEPSPAPDDSRLDVFRGVLDEALRGLPDATRAGLLTYPVTFSCARDEPRVPIAELRTARADIDAALSALRPEGITPTHDAVAIGLSRLAARSAEEARFLVLATDGAATVCMGCDAACSFDALDRDNEALIETVRRAASDGVATYVIGVPGSQGYRGILSRMANAAGTARAGCSDAGPTYCHYDLTDAGLDFATALREALGAIGESVLRCEYDIPPNPDGSFDPTRVNVRLTDESGTETSLPRDPGRAAGWDYSDDGARIELHGSACERARAATGGRIDVLFGCPTALI